MIRASLVWCALCAVAATARAQSEVATPLESAWRSLCSVTVAPRSGDGLISGRVIADGAAKAVRAISVQVTWPAYNPDGSVVAGRAMRKRVAADSTGRYTLCAVPADQQLTLSAATPDGGTVPVTLTIGNSGVAHRDITLPTPGVIDAITSDKAPDQALAVAEGAVVAGVVRDSIGGPLRDARVTISGVAGEIRSNAKGEFTVRGVPAGARVVEVSAIGLTSIRRLVDFSSRDSAFVEIPMARVQSLETVTVRERARLDARKGEIDQRRRAGWGWSVDSLQLDKLMLTRHAFNFPRVSVVTTGATYGIVMRSGAIELPQSGKGGGGQNCAPTIYVDGALSDIIMLNALTKEEIGMIEVFPTAARAPLQYTGTRSNCGVVLVWRRRYLSP